MRSILIVLFIGVFSYLQAAAPGAEKLIDEIEDNINDIGQDCAQVRVKVKKLIDEYRESSGAAYSTEAEAEISNEGEITLSQLRADSASYKGRYLKVKGYVIDVYSSKINPDYYVLVLNETWTAEDYRKQNIEFVKLAAGKRRFGWAETRRLMLDEKQHTFAGTAEEVEWEDKRTGENYKEVSIIVDAID